MRRAAAICGLAICLQLLPAAVSAGAQVGLAQGLDHIPLAVADLEQAAANFTKLGFVIKPGRPHDDGIRNSHVKFPTGEGIELITAGTPTDALAREYVDWLKGGDGGAFWAIYSPDLAGLTADLAARRLDPVNADHVVTFSQTALSHRFFFGDRLRSPTDGPKVWAHPNTAYELKAVWLAGATEQAQLLISLGAAPAGESCAPFAKTAAILRFPGEGDEVMIAQGLDRPQARSIVGATVMVKSLATARAVLDANTVAYVAGCKGQSIWINPSGANGLWLEMRE